MDQQPAHAAIAVYEPFPTRLSLPEDATIDMIDDTDRSPDLDAVDDNPQHFSSNNVYRTTFTVVVAEAYDIRSWRHFTILSQYRWPL